MQDEFVLWSLALLDLLILRWPKLAILIKINNLVNRAADILYIGAIMSWSTFIYIIIKLINYVIQYRFVSISWGGEILFH